MEVKENWVISNRFVKAFECSEFNCKKKFSREESLKCHKRTHIPDSYKFQCDKCGKKFLYKSKLAIHKDSHNPSRACSLCGKTVSTKQALDRHMQRCENDFKFNCPVCKKGFPMEQKFVEHLRVHTKEKPYECSKCGRRFPREKSLINHKRRHEGIKPYTCDKCPWTGFDHSDRYHHMKKKHSVSVGL